MKPWRVDVDAFAQTKQLSVGQNRYHFTQRGMQGECRIDHLNIRTSIPVLSGWLSVAKREGLSVKQVGVLLKENTILDDDHTALLVASYERFQGENLSSRIK